MLKVKTAAQFLRNPKVSSSPLVQKQEFLKRKGLTDEEIQEAFKLSDAATNHNAFHNPNPYTAIPIPQGPNYPCYQTIVYQMTAFQKIKEFFNITALIGVTVYCVYWFYKVSNFVQIIITHTHTHTCYHIYMIFRKLIRKRERARNTLYNDWTLIYKIKIMFV